MNNGNSIRRQSHLIILLGLVSLFSDATYEGAMSLTGQYLKILGASAAIVGFVGGFGELLGNCIRLFSGYAVDRTKQHWTFMFFGYILNLFSVPLLAFATNWDIAVVLVLVERLGKGIRTPARDAILSYSSKDIGRGWAFGLHEAFDQIGAVLGPCVISIVFYLRGGYKESFLILFVPAICVMIILFIARELYPKPVELEVDKLTGNSNRKLPKIFWVYLIFISFSLFGVVPFQISAYHFKMHDIISDKNIPLIFALAMAVDAVSALIIGKLYDKFKEFVLIVIPLFSLPIALLILSKSISFVVIGTIFWGIAAALEESVMRAYIGDTVGTERRAFSYGLFNAITGFVKFIRSALMGLLYNGGYINCIVIGSISMQVISLLLFFTLLFVRHNLRPRNK